MDTKNMSASRETQVATPFGTAPIPVAQSLKQTNYDGALLKDRYLIEGELGRGGIGVVYLARDTQLMNRRVVIKVLLEESGNALHNPWFKKKFEQEIEALTRLDHPGIVGVLDIPILHIATRLWRGIHPKVEQMAPPMMWTLLMCLAAFLCLFLWLLWLRVQNLSQQDEVVVLQRETLAAS